MWIRVRWGERLSSLTSPDPTRPTKPGFAELTGNTYWYARPVGRVTLIVSTGLVVKFSVA